MAQRLSLPPPYGYHLHQKSFSETHLVAPRVEAASQFQPATERLAPPYVTAADYYSPGPRRAVYSHNNAVGIEITVLSNATRQVPVNSWWSHDDGDRCHSRILNPARMSQHPQQLQDTNNPYQSSDGEGADQVASSSLDSRKRNAPPTGPPRSQNLPYNVEEQRRKGSVASGSSAYTGYQDGTSSPSSQGHTTSLPANANSGSKTPPPSNRFFVRNRTSPNIDSPPPEKLAATPSSVPHPLSQTTGRPPRPAPIMTRDESGSPRQIPGSPRTYQPPAAGSQPANYSPVAAYMTTSHGFAFPSSPVTIRAYPSPDIASTSAGFGLAAATAPLGSPRLNGSFPEYRKNHYNGSGSVGGGDDGYGSRSMGKGTVNSGQEVSYIPPRPSMEVSSHGMPARPPPGRRQTRARPVVTHACMTLNRTDRIKLVKFPQSAVYAVRDAIERSWVKGIQKEKESTGQTEIQLRGNPWSGQGEDACPSIYMTCEVMAALYHLGWNLVMCTDISKRALDKDTLVYRLGEIPTPCSFMAVSFNEGDKLRLIKAPNDVINAVKNTWGGNIQRESWKLGNVAWEFKLTGSPWWSSGDESISVSVLLLNMLDALNVLGWELHTSVDITAGPGGLSKNAGADTDCWILRKVST